MIAFGKLFAAVTALALPMVAAEKTVQLSWGEGVHVIFPDGSQSPIPGAHRATVVWDGKVNVIPQGANFQLDIDNVGRGITCHWIGSPNGDVGFHFKNSPSYLSHCGDTNGVTMICEGPEATCQG